MSFTEKLSWVLMGANLLTYLVYLGWILERPADLPLVEVEYLWPLVGALVATIVLTILGSILIAIPQAASGEDNFEPDERDTHIDRRGEMVGYVVFSVGVMGALGLTLAEVDHFWIGNAIYLSAVVATLVGTGVKLVAYRRGF
ncbi:MAG: hypothetical protein DWQ01_00640 [Planctomycetota bacterium]|nr:MAG: hypothetical protein DWQ01_00640 [Planctomycetota bacterium]